MVSPSPRPSLRHVPGLDGLRGLALLGVLLFHADGALPGGYLGVDLFFVLSGFLITSLLLAEHRAQGSIALGAFWARRARRLFPALLSLMPAIALYGRFVARPEDLPALRADALATLAYVANWRAIFSHKSYWELFAAPSPLEHMWSLAIEEQFYVLWPLLVMLLLRRHGRRAVRGAALGILGLSVAAMVLLFDPASPSRVYLGTDTRAAGILAGAVLATWLPAQPPFSGRVVRCLDGVGVVAALGLGVAWACLPGDEPFLYRGGLWLSELAALVLIACAVVGERSVVGRALALRPLALVGTISYGTYLWHWPVDVLLTAERTHLAGLSLQALRFAVTFSIAMVSYRFLEEPIRRGRVSFRRAVVLVPAAVALSVFFLVRATDAGQRMVVRPPPQTFAQVAPLEPAAEAPHLQVLLVGDSTANSLGWGLRGVQRPGVAVELRGQDGCTMLSDMCGGPLWEGHARGLRPQATLVVLGGAFMHGLTLDGRFRKACHSGWDRKFEGTLEKRLAGLPAPDGTVWVVTIPYPLGPWDSAPFRAEVDCINGSLRKASAAVPGVRVLDLAERLCPRGVCERELDGVTIRPDGVHYSVDGAAALARWVLDAIEP